MLRAWLTMNLHFEALWLVLLRSSYVIPKLNSNFHIIIVRAYLSNHQYCSPAMYLFAKA